MPRKPRSKQTLTKAQSRAVRKIAEKVVDSEVEDKKFVMVAENNQLYHNKPSYVSKILKIIEPGYNSGAQSTGALGVKTVRVGDEISLKNINIRFWLSNKDDRPNVMYKGVLFWLPADMAPSDAIVYATQTNKMLDRYNTNQIQIVDKFLVKSTNNYAVDANNHEKSYLATLNKSYKSKKIKYDELSNITKGMDLCFALVCYDAYGTLQTDNIASFAWNLQITFQDA
jgi:hypothetical protein